MKISAIYITKNESQNIIKSIESCKAIADEIIVIDTGSTDNTVDLCKEIQCDIYNYKWENDFSSARNYAISLCKNEIILFLDADECFSPSLNLEDKDRIINCLINEKVDGIAFPSKDIEKETNKVFYTSFVTKLFLNCEEIRYKNSIHEVIFHKDRDLNIAVLKEFCIIHTGYSKNIQEDKIKRNLEILNKIKNKSAMELFYLCRENLSLKNYKSADDYCDLFFNNIDSNICVDKTNLTYLIYFYKREIMENLPTKYSKQNIFDWLKFTEKQIPYIPEVYYDLGIWYFEKNLKESKKYLMKCIAVNENFMENRTEINNFPYYESKIYYTLSKINFLMGDKQESIQRAIVACLVDKEDNENLNLLLFLLQRGRTKDNLEVLWKIYKPTKKEQYERLVIALSATNLREEFIYYSLKYNTDFNGENDNVFYAMILSGQTEQALKALSNFKNDKSNFIMSVGILYDRTEEIYNKYEKYLSDKYKIVVNWLLGLSDKHSKDDTEISCLILGRLILMGISPDSGIFDKIYKYANEKDIKFLVDIYSNMGDHKKSIEIIENFLSFKSCTLNVLVGDYLFSLFGDKQYDKFMEIYDEYYKSGTITKENSYLYLLKSLKKITKHNSQLRRKYMERFNYANI